MYEGSMTHIYLNREGKCIIQQKLTEKGKAFNSKILYIDSDLKITSQETCKLR